MPARMPEEEKGRYAEKSGLPGRTGCPEKRHEKSADDRAFFILSSKRDQMTMRRTAMSLLPQ